MNGHLLYETYQRCHAHWEFMFETFKAEVITSKEYGTLTIYTYIRFLDEIKKYVPTTPFQNTHSSSRMPIPCILL